MKPLRIALLRGVNVGGRRLPMAELRNDLEALGFENVRTYIQSGNVVFRCEPEDAADDAELAERIADSVEARHGFRPRVIVLDPETLREAMERNPFPEAQAEPRSLHLWFLARRPASVDIRALDEAATATERYHVGDRVFYLHTPDGFGRSKLAERAEAILDVPATARNWRTVSRLREMAEEADQTSRS